MQSANNFIAKMSMIRKRLDSIKHRQREHFRRFKILKKRNIYFKAIINVLNTISVTSLVLTFSVSSITLVVCAVSNSLSAVGTAILSVVDMDAKAHSHQTSYLQFVELHDSYIADVLRDNLTGKDLDRILTELNAKVGLILDNCEPIELSSNCTPDMNDNILTIRNINFKQSPSTQYRPWYPEAKSSKINHLFQSPCTKISSTVLDTVLVIPTSPTSVPEQAADIMSMFPGVSALIGNEQIATCEALLD
jgi:hypothetical protein